MSTLMRAEMDTKPDRSSFKSLSGYSSPPNTQPTPYKSRSALSSPSRRQRNSSGTSSLPPSPQVTPLANKETPSTPSRPRKYSPLTVSSFGTGSFIFHTPRTPPKSQRFINPHPSPTLAMFAQVHHMSNPRQSTHPSTPPTSGTASYPSPGPSGCHHPSPVENKLRGLLGATQNHGGQEHSRRYSQAHQSTRTSSPHTPELSDDSQSQSQPSPSHSPTRRPQSLDSLTLPPTPSHSGHGREPPPLPASFDPRAASKHLQQVRGYSEFCSVGVEIPPGRDEADAPAQGGWFSVVGF